METWNEIAIISAISSSLSVLSGLYRYVYYVFVVGVSVKVVPFARNKSDKDIEDQSLAIEIESNMSTSNADNVKEKCLELNQNIVMQSNGIIDSNLTTKDVKSSMDQDTYLSLRNEIHQLSKELSHLKDGQFLLEIQLNKNLRDLENTKLNELNKELHDLRDSQALQNIQLNKELRELKDFVKEKMINS